METHLNNTPYIIIGFIRPHLFLQDLAGHGLDTLPSIIFANTSKDQETFSNRGDELLVDRD